MSTSSLAMRWAGIGVFDSATCFRSEGQDAAGDEALGLEGVEKGGRRRLAGSGVLPIAQGRVLLPQLFHYVELVAVAGGTDAEAGLADAVEVVAGGAFSKAASAASTFGGRIFKTTWSSLPTPARVNSSASARLRIAFPPRQVAAVLLVGGTDAGLRFLLGELADVEELVFRQHNGQLDAEEVELTGIFFLGGAAGEVEFPVSPEVCGVGGRVDRPNRGDGEMAASHAGSSTRPAFAVPAPVAAASDCWKASASDSATGSGGVRQLGLQLDDRRAGLGAIFARGLTPRQPPKTPPTAAPARRCGGAQRRAGLRFGVHDAPQSGRVGRGAMRSRAPKTHHPCSRITVDIAPRLHGRAPSRPLKFGSRAPHC